MCFGYPFLRFIMFLLSNLSCLCWSVEQSWRPCPWWCSLFLSVFFCSACRISSSLQGGGHGLVAYPSLVFLAVRTRILFRGFLFLDFVFILFDLPFAFFVFSFLVFGFVLFRYVQVDGVCMLCLSCPARCHGMALYTPFTTLRCSISVSIVL